MSWFENIFGSDMSTSIILSKKSLYLISVFIWFFMPQTVSAKTIICEMKAITVQNSRIIEIKHEDGTVHTGNSVSENWSYDGKSIKHRLMDERIPCGTKPKSRSEVIQELSSRFSKNPGLYGMNKQEAQLMGRYTANLMKTDKNCHLLVDGAKSTQRTDEFYIDCNDSSGNSKRYWVSGADLKAGTARAPATPISEKEAIGICNEALRSQTTNPSSYKPALLTGTSSRALKENGRNVVEIEFTAKSKLGVEGKYRGRCILESGGLIEAVIEER